MQPGVEEVTAGVKDMKVSRKRKQKPLSKAKAKVQIHPFPIRCSVDEGQPYNLEYIKEYNIDRAYILQNQPWTSTELPPGYVPHRSTWWYPPIFCLGVALSTQETLEFARHLGVIVDESCSMPRTRVAKRLTELCGARPQVRVKFCDISDVPEDSAWVLSLATNYNACDGINVSESFEKYNKLVEEAFGSSRRVMWYLEHTVNHDPSHWWVSDQRNVQSLVS